MVGRTDIPCGEVQSISCECSGLEVGFAIGCRRELTYAQWEEQVQLPDKAGPAGRTAIGNRLLLCAVLHVHRTRVL